VTVRAYDWDGLHRAMGRSDYADDLAAAVQARPDLVPSVPVPGVAGLEQRVSALEAGSGGVSPWVVPSGGDDTSMLNDLAAEAAATNSGVLRLEGSFRTDGPVVFECHVDALGAELWSTAEIAIQVGRPGVVTGHKTLRLPRVLSTAPYEIGSVGIRLVAAKGCDIDVDVYRKASALLFGAEGQGVAYNTVNVRTLRGLEPLVIEDVGPDGWNRENTLIGGQYQTDRLDVDGRPFDPDVDPPTGTVIRIEGYCNGFCFVNPSIEGNGLEWMIDCNGPFNEWLLPRTEGDRKRFRFRGYGSGNTVVGGYGAASVEIVEEGNARGLNWFYGGYRIGG